MIDYKDTYFVYDGKPLISGFSLHIVRGEKVVLYGASGSGKSTLLHSLLGFVRPESGTISVGGEVLSAETVAHIRSLTSWLPQDISLPAETVRELIYTPFEYKANRERRPSEGEIMGTFDKLGLERELIEKRADEISGGQRQRILLCATTLLRRPILLLDEPTAALDHESVERTIEYLRALEGVTMVAVSHDATFISAFDSKFKV